MNETARELDAVLQRLLAGALPVEEIVCEILDLIEDEGATEAFSAVWVDQLLGEAKGLDRRAKEGEAHGLLHGVPFAVDATVAVAKGLDELGQQRVRSTDRGRDAALLAPLRAAGAMILGRTGDGPLAPWRSLPGVLGAPRESLSGGHFVPTRGLVSTVGLSLHRPTFDVPAFTAASLDLMARCSAVLGIAPYAPEAVAPGLCATEEAAVRMPSTLAPRRIAVAAEARATEWLEGVSRLQSFEAQVAAVALEAGSTGQDVRESYDLLATLRADLEKTLEEGEVLVTADAELAWQTLGLPVIRLRDVAVLGRRYEDPAVLAAARAIAGAEGRPGNESTGSVS